MSERKRVSHYCQGKIECIDYIADQGWMVPFCLGNIVKYAVRLERKGDAVADAGKIENYAVMLREFFERGGVAELPASDADRVARRTRQEDGEQFDFTLVEELEHSELPEGWTDEDWKKAGMMAVAAFHRWKIAHGLVEPDEGS